MMIRHPTRTLILAKHAMPELVAAMPPRDWRLGPDGEAQARALALRLREHSPVALVSSEEPKAQRTAELVGAELGVPFSTRAGLEEFDRPALPLLTSNEHARLNAPIFTQPTRRVLGRESGAEAARRFEAALAALLETERSSETLGIISHGTVIALLIAAHNRLDGFELWKELSCTAFVVVTYPGFGLVGGVRAPR